MSKLTLTKRAAEAVLKIAVEEKKEGYGLRIMAFPSCCGFQYGMDFEKKAQDTDEIIEQNGVKLFLDKDTLEFMDGTKIDYNEDKKGFNIDNPNMKKEKNSSTHGGCGSGCSC